MISKHFKVFTLTFALLFIAISSFAQLRLPPGYYWKQLPNGLQVVVIENNKVPLATIEIAVKTGSFTEDSTYNGLSHLFEHMFFTANKDYPSETAFGKREQQLGAVDNANTNAEVVRYFFTLNRDSLLGGLKFMNSAMRYPLYDLTEMQKERKVVDGEFQRHESDPNIVLYMDIDKKMWGDLFTRKNPIGIHEIINTATPEKMRTIKDKYYVPNNSLLTVCGDVKHEAVFAMVEKIYGDWANSGFDPNVKYPVPVFKPLKKSDFFVEEATTARTPLMRFRWMGPSYPTDSASTIAADVFSTIVGLNSSKMQQALINTGLATSVDMEYSTQKYVGPIEIVVTPNPDKIKECYDALMQQISMFDNPDYYTDEQMADAKGVLLRSGEYQKEKPSSLPPQLDFNWCSTSLNYYTDNIDNYQKVTRADIKRYLETYVKDKPLVAGMVISPDLNKTVKAATFFVAK